jgi:hypothetical protein
MISTKQSRSSAANKQIDKLRKRLEAWRTSRKPRSRIPGRLWNSAVRAAGHYGLNKTAKALHLDYYALKKRVDAVAAAQGTASSFIELNPPALSATPECLVELESRSGEKMRIHLKGMVLPDLSAFSGMFWKTKR